MLKNIYRDNLVTKYFEKIEIQKKYRRMYTLRD